jgi:hypothetical protein
VYGIVEGDDASFRLAELVRGLLAKSSAGTVYEGPFRTEGARVWRARAMVELEFESEA